jgi:hypothetical protein
VTGAGIHQSSVRGSAPGRLGAVDGLVGWQGWPGLHRDLRAAMDGAMLFINNGRVMGNLILSGLLDRYSKLKFVSVESGIGWVPFLLEAIDYE